MKFFQVMVLYMLVDITCSHPLQLNEKQREFGLEAGELQRKYQDDAGVLLSLPKQPDRAARIELSLILENMNFTELVNSILIRCMSSSTDTNETNWGAFAADRFTPSQVQVQYFVVVSETQSLEFPGVLDAYLSSGNLIRCLRDTDDGIPEEVDISSGRNVAAPRSGSIVSAIGSTPGWAAGVALAVVAAIGVLALAGVLLKGEDIYLETDFDDYEQDIPDRVDSQSTAYRSTPSDDGEAEATDIERGSKSIASRSEEEGGSKAITSKHDA